jgi:transposase
MHSQRRIINIDESNITLTDYRKRGWLIKGIRNKATLRRRPASLNIIAGISNFGDLYYTINKGKNNSQTFLLFLIKLCEHLNYKLKTWRDNTVILLDNAGYHKSSEIRYEMNKLKIPLMYLGPYHFRMAPIEMFFSFMKSHDLNPLKSKLSTK